VHLPKNDALADHLLAEGLIDAAALERARAQQVTAGGPLSRALVEVGALQEPEVVAALAAALHLPTLELANVEVEPAVLALVPFELALEHGVLPVSLTAERGLEVLSLAMLDPTNKQALEAVTVQSGRHVRPFVAGEATLFAAMRRLYAGTWALSTPPPPKSLLAFDAVTSGEGEPSWHDVSWGKQFREFMREVRAQTNGPPEPADEVQRLAERVIEEARHASFDPWESGPNRTAPTAEGLKETAHEPALTPGVGDDVSADGSAVKKR
jgi:hypothetical protein